MSEWGALHSSCTNRTAGNIKSPVLPDGGSPEGSDDCGAPATPDDTDHESAASRPVVEYCVNNRPSPDSERFGAGIEARAMPCLERCGTCRTTPFFVVDGELHTAATHEDLRETLSEVRP
ncbi:MAG: DUF1450 domain-containing protein [Halobacteriales archaeon]